MRFMMPMISKGGEPAVPGAMPHAQAFGRLTACSTAPKTAGVIANHQPTRAAVLVMAFAALAATALVLAGPAVAAPLSYTVDPTHTYPSFEADHMGISVWRGKLNKSSGTITLDKATGAGTVDIAIDLASIDFGLPQLNAWARGKDFFDVKKHPKAIYQGRFDSTGADGLPTQVLGDLSLHGVTKPVALKLNLLKCVPHPLFKREMCGADASASFRRDDFGLDMGKDYGFDMDVTLRIQVEALAVR